MTDAPITVAFDDQAFIAQRRGGVSKSFVEFAKHLPEHGVEPIFLARTTHNQHLEQSGLVPAARERSALRERVEWATWRLSGHPRKQRRSLPQYDVLHHTFTHPSYLRLGHGPRVVSVYDFMPEIYPELFPLGNPHFAKRRFSEQADAIITDSRSTERDLARFYGDDMLTKTTTVLLGVGDQFIDPTPLPMDLPERYVLFVGVRSGYKEFDRFVDAVSASMRADARLHLVVVGGGRLTDDERRHLSGAGMLERTRQLSPSDAEMPTVYARAAVFVFPSLYEGFGLPTLEALGSGTSTVLADASCAREVGGDLATYFAPGDADAMRAAIDIGLSESVRARAAHDGPSWAARFSWDETARQTADVYRAVLAARA